MKALLGMPLRQTTGFVEALLQLVGLDWAVPDFSTPCRRPGIRNVELPYRGGTGPLNLLIDSTGIKAEREGEWNARKHGGSKRRIWRKIHMGIDEETSEVRAVEVTTSHVGDAPMLPELLDQIPRDQDIGSVTADGAYDTPNAMTLLPTVVLTPSFHPARMPSLGSPGVLEPSPETKRSTHHDTWAVPSGDGGVDTTPEAELRLRCIA